MQHLSAGKNGGIDRHIDEVPDLPAYYTKEDTYVSAAPQDAMSHDTAKMVLLYAQIPIMTLVALIAYVTWQRFDGQAAAVVGVIIYTISSMATWWFTLLVVSGNLLKLREMRRKWDIEKKRMAHVAAMYGRRLDTADRIIETYERIEIGKLDNDAALNQLRIELAQARSSRASAIAGMNSAIAGDGEFATPRGFVTVEVSETRTAILDWIFGDGITFGLYNDAGNVNPEKVNPDSGEILNTTKMPWGSGICKRDAPEWKAISQPEQHPEPFEFRKDAGNRWFLNIGDYPASEQLERAIGLY